MSRSAVTYERSPLSEVLYELLMGPEPACSVRVAARLLSISEDTVEKWCKRDGPSPRIDQLVALYGYLRDHLGSPKAEVLARAVRSAFGEASQDEGGLTAADLVGRQLSMAEHLGEVSRAIREATDDGTLTHPELVKTRRRLERLHADVGDTLAAIDAQLKSRRKR